MWKSIGRFLAGRKPHETPRQKTGYWGEREAERFLKAGGYRILGRRFRIGPKDEIDLIARDRDALVFLEVKTRASEDFGRPFAAVDRRKQYRLARAAVRYLKRIKDQPPAFRFDVVEVIGTPDCSAPAVRHVQNAFPLPKCFRVP